MFIVFSLGECTQEVRTMSKSIKTDDETWHLPHLVSETGRYGRRLDSSTNSL